LTAKDLVLIRCTIIGKIIGNIITEGMMMVEFY